MTTCPLCEAAARTPGDDWMVLADLARCVVRLGENQGLPGWCVLVLKDHREHLHELDGRDQAAIFEDVARVGRAVASVVRPRRINYECLGNVEPHIHWHVIPRAEDDPEPRAPV